MKHIGLLIGWIGIIAGIVPEIVPTEHAIYTVLIGLFVYITAE